MAATPFNYHAEATKIAVRRSIADCFFAAFFSEESAFPLPPRKTPASSTFHFLYSQQKIWYNEQ